MGGGSSVLSHRSYHHWWPMGANLIIDDPELAKVLSVTHLSTLEGWKADLAQEPEKIGRSVGMTSTGNGTQVARMVAQWFTHYTALLTATVTNAPFQFILYQPTIPSMFGFG